MMGLMNNNLRISQFLRQNLGSITEEWKDFAQSITKLPMSDFALRNHIHEILFFIADDVESVQTKQEQIRKSQGKNPIIQDGAGTAHAKLRFKDGFDIARMVAEFRALRASITKLWTQSRIVLTDADINDLIRFNEAIDQLMAESIAYSLEQHAAARKVAGVKEPA